MISNTSEYFENQEELNINLTAMKKLLEMLSFLLIIFTIIYFTGFGCFLVLNDSASWAPQTVTLSSEGPINETYPDSMGEYQLAEEETEGFLTVLYWYRHKDREDRFLMYNNIGNID